MKDIEEHKTQVTVPVFPFRPHGVWSNASCA
jgi:hypothetical protein